MPLGPRRAAALQPGEAAGEACFYFICAVLGDFSVALSGLQFSDRRAHQIERAPRLLHAVFVVNRELLGGLDSGFERFLRVFREQMAIRSRLLGRGDWRSASHSEMARV